MIRFLLFSGCRYGPCTGLVSRVGARRPRIRNGRLLDCRKEVSGGLDAIVIHPAHAVNKKLNQVVKFMFDTASKLTYP